MDLSYFFNEKEKPLDTLLHDGGFCGIFRSIVCIGDSLSSGEFEYVKEDGSKVYADMFEHSWGQHIARTIGSKVYNFSRGGMTAEEYVKTFAEANGFWDKEKAGDAYIIALGVNDLLFQKKPIGTVENIQKDYNNPEDTFVGYYSSIIQRIQKEIQPNAKFFLMTMLKNGDEEYDKIIEAHTQTLYDVASAFNNCYVIDFSKYGPLDSGIFREKFYLNGHLTPAGYILTAKMVMTYIDYIIRHNIKDFDMVGFIGNEELLQ